MDGDQLPQIIKLQAQLLRQKAILYVLADEYRELIYTTGERRKPPCVVLDNSEIDRVLESKPKFDLVVDENYTQLVFGER